MVIGGYAMKKIIFCILSACLLVGCSSTKNPNKDNSQNDAVEETKSQYTIMDTELPDFDYVPINFNNKGYIVSVDGKFGMMDAFGNWMKQTEYGSLFATLMGDNKMTYCAVPTGEAALIGGFSFNSLFDNEQTFCGNSGFGGVVGYFVYAMKDNGEYVLHYRDILNMTEGTDIDWSMASPKGNALIVPLMESIDNYDYSQYFIGTTDGTLYGPFDKSYQAAISQYGLEYSNTFQNLYSIGYELYGQFVIPEKEGYRIYNNKGDKSFDQIVDSYQFITDEQIQYTIGKKVGILDKDLNVLIETDEFEDISTPMNGLFFAKKEGKWHVVRDCNVSDDELYVTPDYVEDRGNPYTANYEMSIRDAPSKSANKLDRTIKENETVQVYEVKMVNNEQWGRIDENQWVCISDLDNSYMYLDVNYG